MKTSPVLFIIILLAAIQNIYAQDLESVVQKAKEYYDAEKYDSAAALYESALNLIELKYGTADTSHYPKVADLASETFLKLGDFEKAETYYLKVKGIYDSLDINSTMDYGLALINLAHFYNDMQLPKKAVPYFESGLLILEEYRGKDNPEYLQNEMGLAINYMTLGLYEMAEPLMLEVVEKNKKIIGENNLDYATCLSNLGHLYYQMDQYDKAEPILLNVIKITENTTGVDSLIYCQELYTLAMLYASLCRYEQSEQLYIRCCEKAKYIIGEEDPEYAIYLNSLAVLYRYIGHYEKAETLYVASLNITFKSYGENDIHYATTLGNLAQLYSFMGRFEEAKSLIIRCLNTYKNLEMENHPSYFIFLNNLGTAYKNLGEYDMAEKSYKEAIEKIRNKFGENNADYAIYINNLSVLYKLMGRYDEAMELMKESTMITKNILGEDNNSYSLRLMNLANLYNHEGLYDSAEYLIKKSIEIDRRQLGENHPDLARDIYALALLYYKLGKYKSAGDLFEEAFDKNILHIINNTGFLSEKELSQFLNSFILKTAIFQSYNYKTRNIIDSNGRFAYNIELSVKGFQLNSLIDIKSSVFESNDSEMVNIYYQIVFLNKKIDRIAKTPISKRTEDIELLKGQVNELEKLLSFKSKIFQTSHLESSTKWNDIYQSLKSEEASIEFTSFNFYDGKHMSDSILYCAIILTKTESLPYMLFLCEEKQFKSALPDSVSNVKEIDRCYKDQILYNLIWKPIDSLLQGQGISTVYFAPSGLLNSVAFSAIKCPDGKLLSEKYNLVRLSSTRTLAMPEEPAPITNAVIYGGIKYDPDTTGWIASAEKYKKEESDILAYNASFRGLTRGGWVYLPGSKKEMVQIAGHLAYKGIDTTKFTGANALEESFYSLSGNNSPSIIHISTHGFYYPDTVSDEYRKNMMNSATGDIQFKYADDPLLRSGLILAGGNNTWKGLPRPEGLEDGILTAREVSNMNLLNTELVVLSACQTGQGDVKGSEGVEGLLRGFKMAGVRYLIMSLWEVPDKETTEFMDHFYSLWPGDLSIRDAFRETQLKMMHKYPNEPHKWAGFVLME